VTALGIVVMRCAACRFDYSKLRTHISNNNHTGDRPTGKVGSGVSDLLTDILGHLKNIMRKFWRNILAEHTEKTYVRAIS